MDQSNIKKRGVALLMSVLFGTLIFSIVFYSMLRPPIRGIADQGDFERMMIWIGASYQQNNVQNRYFHWVNRYYDLGPSQSGNVISSEIPLLILARCVNAWLHPALFDINILGIIQTLLFSIILSINFYYLRKYNTAYGYLFIPFAAIVLTDIGYTAYFNSFYQESAGIIFFFATTTILLKTISEQNSKNTTKNLVLYILASLLLITAKSQYFILFIPVVCSLLMLFKQSISKKILLSLGLSITAFSLFYYFLGTPKIIKTWNIYNSVFPQLLSATNNQERAMSILKLDQKFGKYTGIFASSSESGVNDPELEKFLTPITFPKIILYYLITPKELASLSEEIIRRSFTTTVSYLGYYENTSNHGVNKQPSTNMLWSNFKKNTLIHYHRLVLPLIILVCVGSMYVYKNRKNIFGIPIFFIAACALCQFFVIAFSEGVSGGVEKFLFLFDVCFDLLFFSVGATICIYCVKRINLKKQKIKTAPTISLLISICANRVKQFEMSIHSLTSHPYDASLIELLIFIDCTEHKPIVDILQKYSKYFSKITVFFITKKNSKINHSVTRKNFLATQAKGDYIIFSEPEMIHIHNSIKIFLRNTQNQKANAWICGPVYAAEDVVNSKGELIDSKKPLKNFKKTLNLAAEKNVLRNSNFQKKYHRIDNTLYSTPFYCAMFNRKYFLRLKGLNQNLKVRGYEEMEFFKRFSHSGGKIYIDNLLQTIHLPHKRNLNIENQVSWNLYNSTVTFDRRQHIGQIIDAEFIKINMKTT